MARPTNGDRSSGHETGPASGVQLMAEVVQEDGVMSLCYLDVCAVLLLSCIAMLAGEIRHYMFSRRLFGPEHNRLQRIGRALRERA